jgi:hypothetical protein
MCHKGMAEKNFFFPESEIGSPSVGNVSFIVYIVINLI